MNPPRRSRRSEGARHAVGRSSLGNHLLAAASNPPREGLIPALAAVSVAGRMLLHGRPEPSRHYPVV